MLDIASGIVIGGIVLFGLYVLLVMCVQGHERRKNDKWMGR